VRVRRITIKSQPEHGLRVSACRFSIRRKAFSVLCPSRSYPAGRNRGLWLADKFRITIREERDDGQRIGRQRIPTRVCLRVTTGRQTSTWFGEGSSRSEKVRGEFASSALKKAPVAEVRRITIA
jgi:hypothetical protein